MKKLASLCLAALLLLSLAACGSYAPDTACVHLSETPRLAPREPQDLTSNLASAMAEAAPEAVAAALSAATESFGSASSEAQQTPASEDMNAALQNAAAPDTPEEPQPASAEPSAAEPAPTEPAPQPEAPEQETPEN